MNLNILVVDDSRTVRAVIKKTLRVAKIPVGELIEAENGLVGLEKASSMSIDLIFADINMPIMGGVEMIERIRADQNLNQIPIVVISTDGSDERMSRLQKSGISAHLGKPFQPQEIRDVVCEIFGDIS